MSGGKGGSTTSSVEIPEYIESASKANLSRADELAQLGYTPYYGPDVAAFSPMQEAAFQGTSQAASAFGMPGGGMTGSGMPAPQTFAGGVQGYSSAPLYEGALSSLQSNAPAQYEFIRNMFINPQTGARPETPFGPGGYIKGFEPEPTPEEKAQQDQQVQQEQQAAQQQQALTSLELRMGLTPELKAKGYTIADFAR